MATVTPPARDDISGTAPNPSNAVARSAFGVLHDYLLNLLGSAGTPAAARTALGSTAVGDAVFVAASTAAAQTALDVYSKSEVALYNLIDNSNFAINQRGVTGTVTLAAGAYGHDRWKGGASGCTYTFAASGGITTITISAGSLVHIVDGVELLTGDYKVHWTGTAQGRIVGGSYATGSFTATATSGSNLSLEFSTGTLSKVKMNEGTVANKWYMPNTQEELLKCQRYAFLLATNGASYGALLIGGATSGTSAGYYCAFPRPMRAAPTFTNLQSVGNYVLTNGSGGVAGVATSITLSNATPYVCKLAVATASGLTAGQVSDLLSNTTSATGLLFTADL